MIDFLPEREVILAIGSFTVRWYGLMYVLALVFAWKMWPYLEKWRGFTLTKDQRTELFAWVAGGVVAGGRLGYALFYEPAYFLSNPAEIFLLGHGGMSSHGGMVGVALSLWLYARIRNVDFWKLADVAVVPAALGLALGRMGNFVNQELYGTVTDLPWGISVPGVEGLRHPVQIYSVIKDIFIAGVLYWVLRKDYDPSAAPEGAAPPLGKGRKTTALFLIVYGVLRFAMEFFREQEWSGWMGMSRGQVLTVPVILVGVLLLWRRLRLNHQVRIPKKYPIINT